MTHAGKSKGKAFDGMNSIAANMLLNLTSSMRFEGPLNVDLNDITMNLVPFPRLHFLLASMSPLAAPKDVAKLAGAPRAVDQVSQACHFLDSCMQGFTKLQGVSIEEVGDACQFLNSCMQIFTKLHESVN